MIRTSKSTEKRTSRGARRLFVSELQISVKSKNLSFRRRVTFEICPGKSLIFVDSLGPFILPLMLFSHRKIMVMPRSNQHHPQGNLKSMGYFLQCNGYSDLASWTCAATAELRILSQKDGIDDMSRSEFYHFKLVELFITILLFLQKFPTCFMLKKMIGVSVSS